MKNQYCILIILFLFSSTLQLKMVEYQPAFTINSFLSENFQISVPFSVEDIGITKSQIIGIVFDDSYRSDKEAYFNPDLEFACTLINDIGASYTMTSIKIKDIPSNFVNSKKSLLCRLDSETYLVEGKVYVLTISTFSKIITVNNHFKGGRLVIGYSSLSLANFMYIEDSVPISPFALLKNFTKKNDLEIGLKIEPSDGECKNFVKCSNIYIGNQLYLELSILSHSYVVTPNFEFIIKYPNRTVSVDSSKLNIYSIPSSTSLTPWTDVVKSDYRAKLEIIDLMDGNLLIKNFGENFIQKRNIKLIIEGLNVKNDVKSDLLNSNEFSFILYNKNSLSIAMKEIKLVNFSKIRIHYDNKNGVTGIRHPENWDLFQHSAYPLQFSFTINNDIKSGYLQVSQVNTKWNESMFNFIAATCDFTLTNDKGESIFSEQIGNRPICRPVNKGIIESSANEYEGSGIFFYVSNLKSDINYSFIVWGYCDFCGSYQKVNLTSKDSENTNKMIDGKIIHIPNPYTASSKTQFEFKYRIYSKIDYNRNKLFDDNNIIAESIRIKCTNICYGNRIAYDNTLSHYGFYQNIDEVSKDFILHKEIYDFNLGLAYNDPTFYTMKKEERKILCESENSPDLCFLYDVKKYKNKFKNVFLNNDTKYEKELFFLLKANIDLVKIQELAYNIDSLMAKINPNNDFYSYGIGSLPLSAYVDYDGIPTKKNSFVKVLFQRQYFTKSTNTKDCILTFNEDVSESEKLGLIYNSSDFSNDFLNGVIYGKTLDVQRSNIIDIDQSIKQIHDINEEPYKDLSIFSTISENFDFFDELIQVQNKNDQINQFNVNYFSNCIRHKSKAIDNFKHIYTAFDLQVQNLILSKSTYIVHRNIRFIKLYPEIGIFNDYDNVVNNIYNSKDDVKFLYKFSANFGETCMLELNYEIFNKVSVKNSNSNSNSILLFLNSGILLDSEVTSNINFYPVVGLKSEFKSYGYSSSHLATKENEFYKLRIDQNTFLSYSVNDINLINLTFYEYLTSKNYIMNHTKQQTNYHLYLTNYILLIGEQNQSFNIKEYEYVKKTYNTSNSTSNENYGVNMIDKNFFIPLYCPEYGYHWKDYEAKTTYKNIARIDPIFHAMSLTVDEKLNYSKIKNIAIFNNRIDLSQNIKEDTTENVSSEVSSEISSETNNDNRLLVETNTIPYMYNKENLFYNRGDQRLLPSIMKLKRYDPTFKSDKFHFCLNNAQISLIDSSIQSFLLSEEVEVKNNEYLPNLSISIDSNPDLNAKLNYFKLPLGNFYINFKPFNKILLSNVKATMINCSYFNINIYNQVVKISNSPSDQYVIGVIRQEVFDPVNIVNLKLLNTALMGFFQVSKSTDGLSNNLNMIFNLSLVDFSSFILEYEIENSYLLSINSNYNESQFKNDKASSQIHSLNLNMRLNKNSGLLFKVNGYNKSISECGIKNPSGYLSNCQYLEVEGGSVNCNVNFPTLNETINLEICCFNIDNSGGNPMKISDLIVYRGIENSSIQNAIIAKDFSKIELNYTPSPLLKDLNFDSGLTSLEKLNIERIDFDQSINQNDFGILRLFVYFPRSPVRGSILKINYNNFNLLLPHRTNFLKPFCKLRYVSNKNFSTIGTFYNESINIEKRQMDKGEFLIENYDISYNSAISGSSDQIQSSTTHTLFITIKFKKILYKCGLTNFNNYLLVELYPIKVKNLNSYNKISSKESEKFSISLSWKLNDINICLDQNNLTILPSSIKEGTIIPPISENNEDLCLMSVYSPYVDGAKGVYKIIVNISKFEDSIDKNNILNEISIFLPSEAFINMNDVRCYDGTTSNKIVEIICKYYNGFLNILLNKPYDITGNNKVKNLFISGITITNFNSESNKPFEPYLMCSVNYYDTLKSSRNAIISGLVSIKNSYFNSNTIVSNLEIYNIAFTKEDVQIYDLLNNTNIGELAGIQKLNFQNNDFPSIIKEYKKLFTNGIQQLNFDYQNLMFENKNYSYAITNIYTNEKTNFTIRIGINIHELNLPIVCKGGVYLNIFIPKEYSFTSLDNNNILITEYQASVDGLIRYSNSYIPTWIEIYGKNLIIFMFDEYTIDFKFRYLDVTIKNIINPYDSIPSASWDISIYDENLTCNFQNFSNLNYFNGNSVVPFIVGNNDLITNLINSFPPEIVNLISSMMFPSYLIKNTKGLGYIKDTNKIITSIEQLVVKVGRYNKFKIESKFVPKSVSETIRIKSTNYTFKTYGDEIKDIDIFTDEFTNTNSSIISNNLTFEYLNNLNIYIGLPCIYDSHIILVEFISSNELFSNLYGLKMIIQKPPTSEKLKLFIDQELSINIDVTGELFKMSNNYFYYSIPEYNYETLNIEWRPAKQYSIIIDNLTITKRTKIHKILFQINGNLDEDIRFIPKVSGSNCYSSNSTLLKFTVTKSLIDLPENLKVSDIFNVELSKNLRMLNDDSSINRFSLYITNPIISQPLFLFCDIVCNNQNFNQLGVQSQVFRILVNNSEKKNSQVVFSNLIRGNVYKSRCALTTTHSNLNMTGLLSNNKNIREYNNENITITPNLPTFCITFESKSILNNDTKSEILYRCQKYFIDNKCMICIDNNNNLVEGYEYSKNNECSDIIQSNSTSPNVRVENYLNQTRLNLYSVCIFEEKKCGTNQILDNYSKKVFNFRDTIITNDKILDVYEGKSVIVTNKPPLVEFKEFNRTSNLKYVYSEGLSDNYLKCYSSEFNFDDKNFQKPSSNDIIQCINKAKNCFSYYLDPVPRQIFFETSFVSGVNVIFTICHYDTLANSVLSEIIEIYKFEIPKSTIIISNETTSAIEIDTSTYSFWLFTNSLLIILIFIL